jgi:hypothetical protein
LVVLFSINIQEIIAKLIPYIQITLALNNMLLILFLMKRTIFVPILSTILSIVLLSAMINAARPAIAAASDTSQECKDAAQKISSKAEAHQSNDVCGIELSRDSPILTLFGKKINDQVSMEFPYQPASASSNSQVLMLAEFTLLQSEVDNVNQFLLDHHWTVSAVHNHWLFENPRLIFLHAEKQGDLNSILQDIRNALEKTNCGCT